MFIYFIQNKNLKMNENMYLNILKIYKYVIIVGLNIW
jgi:hypothetical protein